MRDTPISTSPPLLPSLFVSSLTSYVGTVELAGSSSFTVDGRAAYESLVYPGPMTWCFGGGILDGSLGRTRLKKTTLPALDGQQSMIWLDRLTPKDPLHCTTKFIINNVVGIRVTSSVCRSTANSHTHAVPSPARSAISPHHLVPFTRLEPPDLCAPNSAAECSH